MLHKSPQTKSISSYFLRMIAPIVLIFSLVISALSAWNDYHISIDSRIESQKLITEAFASAIRQPLIQGSFVEVKIRSNELAKNKQVPCTEITTGSEKVVSCDVNLVGFRGLNKVEQELFFDDERQKPLAHLTLFFDNSDLIKESIQKASNTFIGYIFLAAILFLALSVGFSRIRTELAGLMKIAGMIDGKSGESPKFEISEFSALAKSLVHQMEVSKSEAEAKAALEIARQVAHDIRSPIISLQIALNAAQNQIDSRIKNALNHSAQRISDIADDVISQHTISNKNLGPMSPIQKLPMSVNLALQEMVNEKTFMCKQAPNISICLNASATDAFIEMRVSDFKRIISNLIDNSIHALSNNGKIEIRCTQTDQEVQISIADNGVGIPENLLPIILNKGGSFGKSNGKGLGLQWAKKTVQRHNGRFEISSNEGMGTEVTIFMPSLRNNVQSRNGTQLGLVANKA